MSADAGDTHTHTHIPRAVCCRRGNAELYVLSLNALEEGKDLPRATSRPLAFYNRG